MDHLSWLDVLPSPRAHDYIDIMFFGKSYRKIHRAMDKPYKFLGRHHRELFHDPAWAYIIAVRLYPSDPNAVLAAEYHIIFDEICSKNPEFRKCLEALARCGRRRKRRRKRKRVSYRRTW